MEAEYAARAATTENNLKLAQQRVAAMLSLSGIIYYLLWIWWLIKFNAVSGAVLKWAQANPALAGTLTKIAVGAIAIVWWLVCTVYWLNHQSLDQWWWFAKGFGVVALAAKGMSMALLTNPITWIVLAIAGAALLIYKNWAPISAFFVEHLEHHQDGIQWWYHRNFSTDHQLEFNRTVLFSICKSTVMVRCGSSSEVHRLWCHDFRRN